MGTKLQIAGGALFLIAGATQIGGNMAFGGGLIVLGIDLIAMGIGRLRRGGGS